jgi:hypothetical protein
MFNLIMVTIFSPRIRWAATSGSLPHGKPSLADPVLSLPNCINAKLDSQIFEVSRFAKPRSSWLQMKPSCAGFDDYAQATTNILFFRAVMKEDGKLARLRPGPCKWLD